MNENNAINPNQPPVSISAGFLGVHVLLPALSKGGASATAYKLLTSEDRYSFLYAIVAPEVPATTIWEEWVIWGTNEGDGTAAMTGAEGYGRGSQNHYAYGASSAWLFKYSLGIEKDDSSPAYKRFILQPTPDESKNISFAKGKYESYYGSIESGWIADSDGKLKDYNATVPANTSATLYLPVDEIGEVTSVSGAVYVGEVIHNGTAAAEFKLSSGGYEFSISPTGDITVNHALGYVAAKEIIHTVTFDTAGGSEIEPLEVPDGETAERPADPVKDDYTFIGWLLDGEVFDFDSPIHGDISLVADWRLTITSIRINAIAIVTVKRGEVKQFTVNLNEGASDDGIVWKTANEALATVTDDGTVTVKNVIGTVVLTATDPLSGRSHSVLLRIAS
jgi:hypothetical protein